MKKLLFSTVAALSVFAGAAQADLADGEYKIGIYRAQSGCMDVQGASTENGANIQMYECNGTDAQTFSITKNQDGETYSVRNVGSNKLLDVENWGNGTNVQQYGEAVEDYRSWYIEQSAPPYAWFEFRLKSNPEICLRAENPGNVTVASDYCTGFSLATPIKQEVLSGSYTLVNYRSRKCASVWNDANGDNALQYNCDVEYGQKKVWNLSHLGNGEYEIRNTQGWKLLDKDQNSSNVQLWEGYPAQSNQKWRIEKKFNNMFKLESVSNASECLAVETESGDDNASLVVDNCANGLSIYWDIVHQ
ncbi:MAG: RICIN domain-containing protein [Fibrobacterales bacterium]